MATKVIFLTTTGTGTWTVPPDWNNSNNSVEVIAGGGSAGASVSGTSFTSGGGGGGYSQVVNITLTGGSVAINIGSGGAAPTTNSGNPGATGGDTCFGNTSITGTGIVCGAKGGGGGQIGVPAPATSGGQASSGVGSTKFSGGGSGDGSTAGQWTGGGAGGPHGNGGNGNIGRTIVAGGGGGGAGGGGGSNGGSAAGSGTGAAGGNNWAGVGGGTGSGAAGSQGGGGSGGDTGGVAQAGGAGGNGTEWTATVGGTAGSGGSGGSGGNAQNSGQAGPNAGAAGLYGAGGSGGGGSDFSISDGAPSAGAPGIIVITYVPNPAPSGVTGTSSAASLHITGTINAIGAAAASVAGLKTTVAITPMSAPCITATGSLIENVMIPTGTTVTAGTGSLKISEAINPMGAGVMSAASIPYAAGRPTTAEAACSPGSLAATIMKSVAGASIMTNAGMAAMLLGKMVAATATTTAGTSTTTLGQTITASVITTLGSLSALITGIIGGVVSISRIGSLVTPAGPFPAGSQVMALAGQPGPGAIFGASASATSGLVGHLPVTITRTGTAVISSASGSPFNQNQGIPGAGVGDGFCSTGHATLTFGFNGTDAVGSGAAISNVVGIVSGIHANSSVGTPYRLIIVFGDLAQGFVGNTAYSEFVSHGTSVVTLVGPAITVNIANPLGILGTGQASVGFINDPGLIGVVGSGRVLGLIDRVTPGFIGVAGTGAAGSGALRLSSISSIAASAFAGVMALAAALRLTGCQVTSSASSGTTITDFISGVGALGGLGPSLIRVNVNAFGTVIVSEPGGFTIGTVRSISSAGIVGTAALAVITLNPAFLGLKAMGIASVPLVQYIARISVNEMPDGVVITVHINNPAKTVQAELSVARIDNVINAGNAEFKLEIL